MVNTSTHTLGVGSNLYLNAAIGFVIGSVLGEPPPDDLRLLGVVSVHDGLLGWAVMGVEWMRGSDTDLRILVPVSGGGLGAVVFL